jgi:hypothetical protein
LTIHLGPQPFVFFLVLSREAKQRFIGRRFGLFARFDPSAPPNERQDRQNSELRHVARDAKGVQVKTALFYGSKIFNATRIHTKISSIGSSQIARRLRRG